MPEAGVHPAMEIKTNTDFVDTIISIGYVNYPSAKLSHRIWLVTSTKQNKHLGSLR